MSETQIAATEPTAAVSICARPIPCAIIQTPGEVRAKAAVPNRGDQGPGEPGDDPPGPVSSQHADDQAQIPLRSRRDEPQRAVAGGIDAAYRTADFLQPVLPG